MDETGDQLTQSLTNGLKSLAISSDSTEVLNDLIEDIKDKCELMVKNDTNDSNNNKDESSDVHSTGHRFERLNDSEADEDNEEAVDCRTDDLISGRSDDIGNDESTAKQIIAEKMVSSEPNKEDQRLTLHGKPQRNLKPRTEKWGESVGIIDESGHNKRVIELDELNNYLILEYWGQRTGSTIYCSLINERYPRFFDSTLNYLQRWRMRYNIFVDKVFTDESDKSLVHLGELHLYFDLMPKFSYPCYINNSFYSNPNEAEKDLDLVRLEKIKAVIDSFRKSRSISQLKFPIKCYLFNKTDHVFDKFKERHHEIMDESRAVHRKATIRLIKQKAANKQTGQSPAVWNRMPYSDRNFGQSSRDFHQTGRPFHRNERKYNEMGPGFGANEKPQYNENTRGFGQNRRGFGNGGTRSFAPSYRKAFPPNDERRRRRDTENSTDMDVMFEDTFDRHDSNGSPTLAKANTRNRGDRTGGQRMDKREPLPNHKDRNYRNNRFMESDGRRQNRDAFRGRDRQLSSAYTPANGPFFSAIDLETTQLTDMGQSYAPDGQMAPTFGRYASTYN